MISEQLMPSLSPTMEEGTIAAWHIQPGDKVTSGQVIAEVQTDKTVVEWEALEDGYVAEVIIPAGELAKVNMVAALFTSKKGEDLGDAVEKAQATNQELAGSGAAAPAAPEANAADPAPAAPVALAAPAPSAPLPPTAPRSAPAAPKAAPVAVAKVSVGATRISPVAARIAAEHGVDVAAISGSGTSGRIVRRDVEAALSNGKRGGSKAANPFLSTGSEAGFEDIGVSPMRQVIGRRLLESKQQLPHFYITERIDASALMTLRSQLNTIDGVKITFNDLVVKATALTLVRHPGVNSTFHGDVIRQFHTADISIAVAIPDGLITPILGGAEGLTLSQINASVKDLAQRAAAGTLAPEEYQGGSFTISNLGMFGIEEFNAIINPPQAAILAVGGIKDEAVVSDGAVVPGKTMRLTLSADHRVVDGAVGAAFMKDLRQLLENPSALML